MQLWHDYPEARFVAGMDEDFDCFQPMACPDAELYGYKSSLARSRARIYGQTLRTDCNDMGLYDTT